MEQLADYMNVGRALHEIRKLFASKRKFGEYLKAELPEFSVLRSELRTNCKWLFEALNVPGSEGADILEILGKNDMAEYYSANPTVIRRDYRNTKKAKDKNMKN